MKFCIRMVLALTVLCLAACVKQDPQTEAAAQKRIQCQMTCMNQLAACDKVCRNNCRNCQAGVYRTTEEHFSDYVREQYVKGQILTRELKSYRDPLQCRKVTCDCQSDHKLCMQSCTGVIRKSYQAAPYCP